MTDKLWAILFTQIFFSVRETKDILGQKITFSIKKFQLTPGLIYKNFDFARRSYWAIWG